MKKLTKKGIAIGIIFFGVAVYLFGVFSGYKSAGLPISTHDHAQAQASTEDGTSQTTSGLEFNKEQEAELLIFVSLDAPVQSLKDWGAQAASMGVPLLIREMPQALSAKSQQKMGEILKADPKLWIATQAESFQKFNIQEFDIQENPIVVLVVQRPRLLSFLEPRFIKIEGSPSLAAALVRILHREGEDPVFADAAYPLAYRLFGQ